MKARNLVTDEWCDLCSTYVLALTLSALRSPPPTASPFFATAIVNARQQAEAIDDNMLDDDVW